MTLVKNGGITIAKEIFDEIGLVKDALLVRHPFSYLMEAADDICYTIMDLENALELKLIKLEGIAEIFEGLSGKSFDGDKWKQTARIPKLRSLSIDGLIDAFCAFFELNLEAIAHG